MLLLHMVFTLYRSVEFKVQPVNQKSSLHRLSAVLPSALQTRQFMELVHSSSTALSTVHDSLRQHAFSDQVTVQPTASLHPIARRATPAHIDPLPSICRLTDADQSQSASPVPHPSPRTPPRPSAAPAQLGFQARLLVRRLSRSTGAAAADSPTILRARHERPVSAASRDVRRAVCMTCCPMTGLGGAGGCVAALH